MCNSTESVKFYTPCVIHTSVILHISVILHKSVILHTCIILHTSVILCTILILKTVKFYTYSVIIFFLRRVFSFTYRKLLSCIYALSSVKFAGVKLWLCKKSDKYEVWPYGGFNKGQTYEIRSAHCSNIISNIVGHTLSILHICRFFYTTTM